MGDTLSVPITTKEYEGKENNELVSVVCEMQGWRTSQEDSFVQCLAPHFKDLVTQTHTQPMEDVNGNNTHKMEVDHKANNKNSSSSSSSNNAGMNGVEGTQQSKKTKLASPLEDEEDDNEASGAADGAKDKQNENENSSSSSSSSSSSGNQSTSRVTQSEDIKDTSEGETETSSHSVPDTAVEVEPIDLSEVNVFGVFDGHGGSEVSQFCKSHYLEELAKLMHERCSHPMVADLEQGSTSEQSTNVNVNANANANISMEEILKASFHMMDELLLNGDYHDEIVRLQASASAAANSENNDDSDNNEENNKSSSSSSSSNAKGEGDKGEEGDKEGKGEGEGEKEKEKENEKEKEEGEEESETETGKSGSLGENGKDLRRSSKNSPTPNPGDTLKGSPLESVKAKLEEEVEGKLSSAHAGGGISADDARAVVKRMRDISSIGSALNQPTSIQSGATANIAVKVGNKLYVANSGDCRAVLCRGTKAIPLSIDHKPSDYREYERIYKSGAFSVRQGRIDGSLNLSRAIGDFRFKRCEHLPKEQQPVTADPDVTCTELTSEDQFFIVACDGIWDTNTNQYCIDFVLRELKKYPSPPSIANLQAISAKLFSRSMCDDPFSCNAGADNMTSIIVWLKNGASMGEPDSSEQ